MYAAASNNSGVATAAVSGSTLAVAAVARGAATVTVTASDPEGLAATQTFKSTIPNRPPGPTGIIPGQTLYIGDTVTVDLPPYFDDPDGDALTYTAASSSPAVATAMVAGTTVTIAAVAQGMTTVTVTARDTEGLTANQTFETAVPNRPPGPVDSIPDQTLHIGDTITLDLSPYFEDLDGDALTYTASSSNSFVATASVSGSSAMITAAAKGATTVTVTATDPGGLTATQTFESTVPNRPPGAVGTVPERTVRIEVTITVDLAPYFHDPDADPLTYTAASSNAAVATASVAGSLVTITGVAVGSATITLTARDPDRLTATQQVGVTVRLANRAPRPVRRIPTQRLAPGRTATINASRYFDDPDDDPLTYSASSSNSGVARVSVSGSAVRIRGVATGSATITVTARDPSGLTATLRAAVRVQANRAPEPAGTIPALELAPAETATVDASEYFTDPDGDALAYTAESSNSSVATASVSGSTVTITAVADGSATITVAAQDPGGLTATQWIDVTVTGSGAGLRDDFSSSASLDDWQLARATAEVNNGVLELTSTEDLGVAARVVDTPFTMWTIEITMGRDQTTDSYVGLRWITGHSRYSAFDFLVGSFEGHDYALSLWDAQEGQWLGLSGATGSSSAINDGAGELTTIQISFIDGRLKGFAGGTELFDLGSELFDALVGRVDVVALLNDGAVGGTVLFDWIDVDGVAASGRRSLELPGVAWKGRNQ